MDEINKQLRDLGISPEEISQKMASMGISLDEIAKKFASLSLPGIFLVATFSTFGGTGLIVTLATALSGSIGVIGDNLTGYGIEIILASIYIERSKTEVVDNLLREIDILPITESLKLKIKSQLSQVKDTENHVIDTPQIITIIED